MTDPEPLRPFTIAVLEDVGAGVRDDGTFHWVAAPDDLQTTLDLPPQACITFEPDRAGEFDAELVAPGSYLLEKLLTLAMRRGRWDVARLPRPSGDWVAPILASARGISRDTTPRVVEETEAPIVLFAFRTTLTSDEKRESFHLVAATLSDDEAWVIPRPVPEDPLVASALPQAPFELGPAYRRARGTLAGFVRDDLGSFEKTSLAALEEEVRRIFRYFDGTVAEVRGAAPSGAEDIVAAIEAERGRRLAEAVERLEPHAVASLCSVRLIYTPVARVTCRTESGEAIEIRVDALTRTLRGLPETVKAAGPVPPQARRRSDTPPRRTTVDRVPARSPRGSKARFQSGAAPHRGP